MYSFTQVLSAPPLGGYQWWNFSWAQSLNVSFESFQVKCRVLIFKKKYFKYDIKHNNNFASARHELYLSIPFAIVYTYVWTV